MERLPLLTLATGLMLAAHCPAGGQTDAGRAAQNALTAADTQSLPAPPSGKSTLFGGEIQTVDPVRDQLTLEVYGQKPMKILFDERTRVFRDGARIPLRDLRPEDHASVETALNGSAVFAVSIHILSHSTEGEYSGRVIEYSAGSGELVLGGVLSGEPFRLLVASSTKISREGQTGFAGVRSGESDLVPGALVSAKFESNGKGQGIASSIAVLAVPGSAFVFGGDVSFVDLHTGSMVLTDTRDAKTYRISFDPDRIAASLNLREGQHVRVVADYENAGYVASEITIY